MIKDKQLRYLICIYFVATVFTFALDWQLPGFSQLSEFSKHIDLDQYLIPDYMTYWQLTHYLTRVFLGYFCPKYWKIIFIIDFGWETLECYKWGAHNWYDLVWNMLGLITGMMLRHYNVFDKFFNSKNIDKNDEEYNKVNLNNSNEIEENNTNKILENSSNIKNYNKQSNNDHNTSDNDHNISNIMNEKINISTSIDNPIDIIEHKKHKKHKKHKSKKEHQL